MDILSGIGFVLALVAVLVGAVLKGAAIYIQTPLAVFKHAMSRFSWVIKPPQMQAEELIKKIVEWSTIARKQGLLGLEPLIEQEQDPFVKRGLQLVVDGGEPDAIRAILEVEVGVREHADNRAAKVYEGMGIYSPTLGIIGAVLGLMAVMQNLADPSKLGHGIAAAFVATIYGIGLANLFFLPAASKLKVAIQGLSQAREMVIEGMISMAQGENPPRLDAKLQGYLH